MRQHLILLLERLAGRLLVRAAVMRRDSGGPENDHEIEHIYAALLAGNSQHGEYCPLNHPCWEHIDKFAQQGIVEWLEKKEMHTR